MSPEKYYELKEHLKSTGYKKEIDWAEDIKLCGNSLDFWCEYSWVVINSGMKEQIARKIWDKILASLEKNTGDPLFASRVFGHKGKASAIEKIWQTRETVFYEYGRAKNKLAFLQSLPWIGKITQYHLAKNLGFDCIKPDRHLVRVAKAEGKTPEKLCQELKKITGDHLAVIDTVIWRAANLGII